MAEKTTKELERIYTIPLRDVKHSPRNHRTDRAVRAVKSYLQRHMKAEDVWIDTTVNEKLWERGMYKLASKIRVRALKFDDGVVEVTLPEADVTTSRRADMKKAREEREEEKAKKEEKKDAEEKGEKPAAEGEKKGEEGAAKPAEKKGEGEAPEKPKAETKEAGEKPAPKKAEAKGADAPAKRAGDKPSPKAEKREASSHKESPKTKKE
ncbi:MAG: 50S ribosomal protein L31e [Euryarchaeota archaeon]|nr:50S ribosomal protein L31e [Euryarchaeota archaeon]